MPSERKPQRPELRAANRPRFSFNPLRLWRMQMQAGQRMMSDCRIPHSPGIVNASQSQRGMVPTIIRRFERPNETAGYNFATVSFSSRIGWLPALRSQSGCWHTRVTLKRPPRRIPSLQLDKGRNYRRRPRWPVNILRLLQVSQ